MSRDTPTAFITIEDHGKEPLRIDFKLNGVPETFVLTGLYWLAKKMATDLYNRAIVSCGTDDPETVKDYMRTQQKLDDSSIGDILENL